MGGLDQVSAVTDKRPSANTIRCRHRPRCWRGSGASATMKKEDWGAGEEGTRRRRARHERLTSWSQASPHSTSGYNRVPSPSAVKKVQTIHSREKSHGHKLPCEHLHRAVFTDSSTSKSTPIQAGGSSLPFIEEWEGEDGGQSGGDRLR